MSNRQTTAPESPGTAGKVALHKKTKPIAKPPVKKQTLGKNIDEQILQIVSGNFDEKVTRTKFVQMGLSIQGIVGVCFVSRDAQDLWAPSMASPSAGRVPDRRTFAEQFSEQCDTFVTTRNIQSVQLPFMGDLYGQLAPIRPRNSQPELLFVVAQSQSAALMAVQTLQKMTRAIELWQNGRDSADADWQVIALAAIVEIVAKLEKQETNKAAAEELANLLANRLGCSSVAVGLMQNRKMKLSAISGVGKIDQGSASSVNYLQTMVESVTRKRPGLFPAINDDNNFLLQAHRQLASTIQSESVFSIPLYNEEERCLGAIVMTGTRAMLSSSQVARFTAAATPSIASALEVVDKVKQTTLTRTKTFVKRKLSWTRQLILLTAAIGFILLMFLPITYRVRCNCVTEPVSRRFAVAPFDGQIVAGHVEAGDRVDGGQVLAEMDGRSIRWELSGVTAEREQSLRTREMELTERNVPKTILAELEYDRLVSEEEILQYKRDNLNIKSPIDGIVLSGSLERAEAASVETGQVLFEIGPVKPMRIEVAVPSTEIAQVQVGFPAKIWIDGQEDEPITGKISKIRPRSETRDADNVFIAELEFANEDERLRPGMKGSVRLDCERRSLGWSLFHKPINYVRSRLTWW